MTLPVLSFSLAPEGMTKRDQVYHMLADGLMRGQWYPGERLPAEQVLTEWFQCSRVTLRVALGRLEKLGLIIRRQGSGTYVAERVLRSRHSIIALIERQSTPALGNSRFINQQLQFFLQSAARHQVLTSVVLIGEEENFFKACARLKLELNGYDGFIFAFPLQQEEIRELERQGIRYVSLTKPAGDEGAVSYVDIDNCRGMFMAATHLLELGYQHPVLLNGPETRPYNREKTRGFLKALETYGIPFQAGMHCTVPPHDERLAAQCVDHLLARKEGRPDSLLVYGDWATFGTIRELQRRGRDIPRDLALVAYEAPDWISRCTGVSVTRIEQPLEEQMSQAMDLLLQIMDSRTHPCTVKMLQPSLRLGESTGCTMRRRGRNGREHEVFQKHVGTLAPIVLGGTP